MGLLCESIYIFDRNHTFILDYFYLLQLFYCSVFLIV